MVAQDTGGMVGAAAGYKQTSVLCFQWYDGIKLEVVPSWHKGVSL